MNLDSERRSGLGLVLFSALLAAPATASDTDPAPRQEPPAASRASALQANVDRYLTRISQMD